MAGNHPVRRLETLALIGIGGFAGATLRYFVSSFAPGPRGTLVVNTLGSFVLGFVLYEALYSGLLAERTRIVVGTGFLSSFTTYSTFALQTIGLPHWLLVTNVLATYALGFAGVLAGRELARSLDGSEGERNGGTSG